MPTPRGISSMIVSVARHYSSAPSLSQLSGEQNYLVSSFILAAALSYQATTRSNLVVTNAFVAMAAAEILRIEELLSLPDDLC